jgi:hypothetical protein
MTSYILLYVDQQHHFHFGQIVDVAAFSSVFTAEGSLPITGANKEHGLIESNTQTTKYLAPQK